MVLLVEGSEVEQGMWHQLVSHSYFPLSYSVYQSGRSLIGEKWIALTAVVTLCIQHGHAGIAFGLGELSARNPSRRELKSYSDTLVQVRGDHLPLSF